MRQFIYFPIQLQLYRSMDRWVNSRNVQCTLCIWALSLNELSLIHQLNFYFVEKTMHLISSNAFYFSTQSSYDYSSSRFDTIVSFDISNDALYEVQQALRIWRTFLRISKLNLIVYCIVQSIVITCFALSLYSKNCFGLTF